MLDGRRLLEHLHVHEPADCGDAGRERHHIVEETERQPKREAAGEYKFEQQERVRDSH